MTFFVVDMTHGGLIIASELAKLYDTSVFAWDIYGTVNESTREEYSKLGLNFVDNFDSSEEITVVAPVHCNLEYSVDMTHHEAVKHILNNKIIVPIIEVTGVKGKTSVVWILKEILKDLNPLVLSSLGVEVFDGYEWKTLKQNISITPASIIEAWKLAENYKIGICIFETSLGGTGLADVGILTNIAENYSIANNTSLASIAKAQIFDSKMVACDLESFNSNYSEYSEKTNTFGVGNKNSNIDANMTATNIKLGFNITEFNVKMYDFKTLNSNILEGSFNVRTFAPAKVHINNILGAVAASLMLGISQEKIQSGLSKFKGVKGRTTIKEQEGIRIVEEINPGLNVTAVKESIKMMTDLDDVAVIFGGKYGITCEEIDEKSVSKVLNDINGNYHLILVDELGYNVKNIITRDLLYYTNLNDAVRYAVKKGCSNILIIYRSNYSDLEKR